MTRLYQETKHKYDEAARTIQGYIGQLAPSSGGHGSRQPQPQPVMVTAGCRDTPPRGHAPWKAHNFGSPASIVTDCPPSITPSVTPEQGQAPGVAPGGQTPSGGSLSSVGEGSLPEGAAYVPEGGVYVCQRCEREFPVTHKSKYEDHLRRCTDD